MESVDSTQGAQSLNEHELPMNGHSSAEFAWGKPSRFDAEARPP